MARVASLITQGVWSLSIALRPGAGVIVAAFYARHARHVPLHGRLAVDRSGPLRRQPRHRDRPALAWRHEPNPVAVFHEPAVATPGWTDAAHDLRGRHPPCPAPERGEAARRRARPHALRLRRRTPTARAGGPVPAVLLQESDGARG